MKKIKKQLIYTVAIYIENKYGNVDLERLFEHLEIHSPYYKFTIEEFNKLVNELIEDDLFIYNPYKKDELLTLF